MIKIKEKWVDIPKYEGSFQISNHGRIRSLDRVVEYTTTSKNGVVAHIKRFFEGRIRLMGKCRAGYASLVVSTNSKNHTLRPARLVAAAFLPPPKPDQFEINHIDGVPLNNYFENLEWCTHKENMAHATETGLIRQRINTPVLEEHGVRAIRFLYASGDFSQWQLATMFGVSQPHINNIIAFRTWKLK